MTSEDPLIVQAGQVITKDASHSIPLVSASKSQDIGSEVAHRVTIESLDDDVILAIFGFCVDTICTESWYILVHVCRRWRCVAFTFSRRLQLRVLCTEGTAVKKTLDIWPPLPIAIWGTGDPDLLTKRSDNIIAALELRDRVCEIDLHCIPVQLWDSFMVEMQAPFPTLTSLQLGSMARLESVVPDSFLGGSAPRLQTLWLDNVPFPALPTLLLSATDLVHLYLWDIPDSGHILPEMMVACLSVMTRLETLHLTFHSRRFLSDQIEPQSPLTPLALPSLTSFNFRGAFDYLEDLITRIDGPLLDDVTLMVFGLRLNSPHFLRFVSQAPKLNAFDRASVVFRDHAIDLTLFTREGPVDGTKLLLEIPCEESRQLWSLAEVCRSPLLPLSNLERLDILEYPRSQRKWQDDDVENTHWVEVLRPFITVRNLHLSEQVAPRVAVALQELDGRSLTEMLPALQHIFLRGWVSLQEAFGQFVSARQVSGHPVTLHELCGRRR